MPAEMVFALNLYVVMAFAIQMNREGSALRAMDVRLALLLVVKKIV